MLALLVLGVAYLVSAWKIPMDAWTAEELINARTMPLLYGCLLIVALLLGLLKKTPVIETESGQSLRMVGVIVLVLVFLLVLPKINLWIGIAGLLAALAFWLGERRTLPVLTLAVVVPLIGWLGIEVILDLHLPQ